MKITKPGPQTAGPQTAGPDAGALQTAGNQAPAGERPPANARQLTAPLRRKARIWGFVLSAAVFASIFLCVSFGSADIAPNTVMHITAYHLGLPIEVTWTVPEESIVWGLRMPRVLLGFFVGASLAVSGAALQAMVRNVLADPYVLGISSGASTGAAVAILFGFAAGVGQYALPTSGFAGALAASLLVFVVARSGGRITSVRLLLSGIAIGYALSAATSFLIFASDDPEGSRSVMFWMLGSLALARWDALLLVAAIVTVSAASILSLWSARLDALASGDETALTLGIRPDRARIQTLIVVSLATGVAVAAAGAIGFVGLVVPHLARRMVGSAHARLVPIAALLGALLLAWADALGRVIMAPRELPIGIITALIGAPFLTFLIRRMNATRT